MHGKRALPIALFIVFVTSSASSPAVAQEVLHDLSVVSDELLIVGTTSTIGARVTAATDLNVRRPVAGAMVSVELVALDSKGRAQGVLTRLGSVRSGADGRAVVEFLAPRTTSPSVAVRVRTDADHGGREVIRRVSIEESALLHLRTDRGVYQPGTPLRWRMTALHGIHSHPIAGLPVEVEVRSPRGSPIWRGELATDKAGMVSGEIPLADDAPTGRYSIRASAPARAAYATETVVVRQITLPPFIVSVTTSPADPKPGEEVVATVTARYPHGEPVAGEVNFGARVNELTLVKREGKLDRFGKMTIRFRPPIGDHGVIAARVIDGAGRSRRARHDFDLPGARLRMALIPESYELAPGRRHIYVITTDGRGTLVPTEVRLEWTGAEKRRTVKSDGVVRVPIDVRSGISRLRVVGSAAAADGRVAIQEQRVYVGDDSTPSATLRETVITAGKPVEVNAHWPEREGPVVATLIRNGVPLSTDLVAFGHGTARGAATLRAPTGSFGLATLRLAELRFDKRTGALRTRTVNQVVYLDRRRLEVKIDATVRHAPGERAVAQVLVTHSDGLPALGAHIAASVVDERVLALSAPRPDLARVLDDFGSRSVTRRRDAAGQAGLIFAELLKRNSDVDRRAMRALLVALSPTSVPAKVWMSEAERVAAEAARIIKLDTMVAEHMFKSVASLGQKVAGAPVPAKKRVPWQFAVTLEAVLAAAGAEASDRLDPWKRATTWSYARQLVPSITFERHADNVLRRRFAALSTLLVKRRLPKRWLRRKTVPASLADVSSIPRHLTVDPWGTPLAIEISGDEIVITSAGPDQVLKTGDDDSRSFGPRGTIGYGEGFGSGSGSLGGRSARAPRVRVGNAQMMGGMEANLRKRFDETVLWTTGVATDSKGRVTLDVPLSDSVTGWQLDIEAVGPRGGVGVARGRFETHLARYVDAAMPAGLSVGDQFALPLVVANHTARPSKMSLAVEVRGAISASGEANPRDVVAANSTRAFALGLRADEPGKGTVKVTMSIDGKAVDAFERTLEVVHPGALERRSVGEVVANGKGTLALELGDAAAGTTRGTLRVYRGTLDRAIEGIDSLVREPYGCFEQTSSATYPNLLVMRLLRAPDAPSAPPGLAARAARFVAKGYQRLVSYEVAGGGFSWFGESPANQVLTAYGLLEFTDMATVYPVDQKMVKRTRRWLLSKQRRDGSWRESKNTLGGDSVIATTAYVAWALAESGYRGAALERALGYLGRNRRKVIGDSYALSLWAAAEASFRGRLGVAGRALEKRLTVAGQGMRIKRSDGEPRSLFYASGNAADAQASALAAMALHRAGKEVESAKILRWLGGDGSASWAGSTQGTVLALRAMALAGSDESSAGMVKILVNGVAAGEVDLAAGDLGGIDIAKHLRSGKNRIELRGDSRVKGLVSTSLEASWRQKKPAGATSGGGLSIARVVGRSTLKRGEETFVELIVRNKGTERIEMPMVVASIPPGFTVETPSSRNNRFRKVENVGSELRFYLSELAAGETRRLRYKLEASHVASVLHRPATAYAYYQPDVRATSSAARLVVSE